MAVIQIPLDPLLRSQHARRCLRGREQSFTAPATVLALVDDPGMRLNVGLALQTAGFEVRWPSGSLSGFPVELQGADLIVAEPHSIPWESLQAEMGRRPDGTQPVVVVLGGNDDPERIEKLLDAGVACCLAKSLPADLLERELRRLASGVFAGRQDSPGDFQRRSEKPRSGKCLLWPFPRGY